MDANHDTETILIPPPVVMTLEGYQIVKRSIGHPAGACKIIKPEYMTLELVTDKGSRHYGFDRVFIGADLTMHCIGFDRRFEELKKWEHSYDCPCKNCKH